ncbi:MAG: hypothetical protein ABI837_08725 [Acidobacteriota bacterium]
MIDRPSRDQLAALLHLFADGGITEDEFEERRPHSRDRAVREIVGQARLLYGDRRDPSHAGRQRVSGQDRRELTRWSLFLQHDLEYAWPSLPLWATILGAIPNVLTFGLFWRPYRKWFESRGDHRVWPFRSEEELRKARREKAGAERAG